MQLFGGLLIAVLGVLSARAFFQPRPKAAALAPSRTIASAFGTTYLLTLSNPMTIIAFTGMIAGLGAAAGTGGQAAYVLVLGVFLGSALWWLILVADGALGAQTTDRQRAEMAGPSGGQRLDPLGAATGPDRRQRHTLTASVDRKSSTVREIWSG